MNHYMEVIAAFLTGIVGPLLVQYYITRQKRIKDKNSDPVAEQMVVCSQIDAKLEKIKEEYKADRVWIDQFHNGGHFYPSGKSIQKFSMFYEVLTSGTESVKMIFQNIPVSLFSRSTNHLLEHSHLAVPDFKDETIATLGLKYTAAETGTKSGYYFAIKNIDGKFIGIMGLDYCKKKAVLSPEQIIALDIEAGIISGYLY